MIEKLKWDFLDTVVITKRNILRYMSNLQLIFFSTIQPVIFLSLFNYVFGGSLSAFLLEGFKYIMLLLPGILVQNAVYSGVNTDIGLAEAITAG